MDNTNRVTIKLREKPLRNGHRALILDCYIGASGERGSRVEGQRFRQHLGLYLSNDNSPETEVENNKILTKANEIIAAKKEEIYALLKENSTPVPDLSFMEETSENRLKAYSVRLRKKMLKNKTESLYLDFSIGKHEVIFDKTLISGRKKYYLSLYLLPGSNETDTLQNQVTLDKAKKQLTKAVICIESVLKGFPEERSVVKSNLNEF